MLQKYVIYIKLSALPFLIHDRRWKVHDFATYLYVLRQAQKSELQ